MSELWSDFVKNLEPYVPGEQPRVLDLVKLNTNENPYPPSPRAVEALRTAQTDLLRLYPDPASSALRLAIANRLCVPVDQVFVGNGSDEVLGFAFMAFFKRPKPLLFPDITYSFYKVYCQLFDIQYRTVPLNDQFEVVIDQFSTDNGGIIIPNPNAPTGIAMPLATLDTLVASHPESVVIIDEAYVDFGADSAVELISQYPNLLVIQTLSKSRSLAGLRLGYAVGHRSLIDGLERVKNSFNSYPIDRLAEAAGVAAIADDVYFNECCEKIVTTRQWTTSQLELRGFRVLPSSANFVFVEPSGIGAADLFERLRESKVLVRHFGQSRIDNFLRITIGTDREMQLLIDAIDLILTNY